MRAIDIAASGLERRMESVNRTAERLATNPVDADTVRDIVQLNVDKHGFQAGIQVIRAADEMTESLLHVIA